MKTHIKIVGVLHVAWNFLHVAAAALAILLYFAGATALGLGTSGAGEPGAGAAIFAFLATFGIFVGCLALAPSLPGFLAGFGLLRYRSWARWVIVVVSVLYLFELGLGTVLGVYSLWALLNDDAEMVFRSGGRL